MTLVLGMNAWKHRSCDHHPGTLLQDRPRNCSSQALPRLDDSSGCGRAVDSRILHFWHPSIRVVETCTRRVSSDDAWSYQSSVCGRYAYCLIRMKVNYFWGYRVRPTVFSAYVICYRTNVHCEKQNFETVIYCWINFITNTISALGCFWTEYNVMTMCQVHQSNWQWSHWLW